MAMTIDRDRLRKQLRTSRRAIPVAQRMAAAESLAQHLLALPFAPASGFVAGYWAMDGEIALHVWQLRLPPALTYCLPVLSGQELRFAPWSPGEPLVTNRFGIPEPDVQASDCIDASAITMAVAPVVGFDRAGNRLGMGGGWYDRSFAFRRSQPAPPWLVGAAFSIQEVDDIPSQQWDVGLDAICTESGCHITNGPSP
jgi:5-formyltetrahydrofolate cyclo-ligase